MNLPKASKALVQQHALNRWREDGNLADLPAVYFLAVRGYRKTTMGDPTRNDVGIFDDAFFLVTPDGFYPENANTDPSRLGWNPGVGKPYGLLQPGTWYFYPGAHKGRKPALRQADDAAVGKKFNLPHNGQFCVQRTWGWNDPRNYLEWGYQQVNVHPAAMSSTSSWLCLTLPYDRAFYWLNTVTIQLANHKQQVIPCMLIEGPIN